MALVPLGEHPAITAVLAAASGFELGQISEEEMHEAVRQNHLIVMRAMGEAIDERIIHRGFQVLEIALCSSQVAIQEAALAAITYAENVNEQKISGCVVFARNHDRRAVPVVSESRRDRAPLDGRRRRSATCLLEHFSKR